MILLRTWALPFCALPLALVLALTAGCSGDDSTGNGNGDGNNGPPANNGGTNNGGTNNGGPDAPAPPAPPARPELTDWDCPEGWLAEPAFEDGSIQGLAPHSICRPPPLPEDCPVGFMPLVGHAECVRQGLACPEDDDWHDEATIRSRAEGFDGRIWYLSPSGNDEGDGSRQAPFATLAEAMRQSNSGHILALGKGQFHESIRTQGGLGLVGACTTGTSVVADTASEESPVVEIDGSGAVALVDLTISGSRRGIDLRAPGDVLLRAVTLERTHGVGVRVSHAEARLRLEDSVIQDTLPQDSDLASGYGLTVTNGARVEVHRTTIVRNRAVAVFASGAGTQLRLEDVALTHTQPQVSDMLFGWGLGVHEGASVQVVRGLIDSNHGSGVEVLNQDAVVTMEDVQITRTQPGDNGAGIFAIGLDIGTGTSVNVVRGLVDQNYGFGVVLHEDGALTMEDSAISHTQPMPGSGDRGWGLANLLTPKATAQLTRVLIAHNHVLGVSWGGEGSVLQMGDVAIIHTQPRQSNSFGGIGLFLEADPMGVHDEGVSVAFARGLIAHSHSAGIIAINRGCTLTMEDLTVQDTQPAQHDSSGGIGIMVLKGAHGTLLRGVVARNRTFGVLVGAGSSQTFPDSRLTMEDVVIEGTLPQLSDMTLGRGLTVQDGASVEFARGLVQSNHEAGIYVLTPGTRADLQDITVRDTRSTPCSRPSDCNGFLGSGIIAFHSAMVTVENFDVSGSALAGVQIIDAPGFAATEGIVHRNTIGVNIQQVELDLDDAFTNVQSFDNENDLDFQDLPVPSAAEVLDLVDGD